MPLNNDTRGLNMRVSTSCLACVIASLHGAMAAALMTSLLSEIEEPKAARLMKNKEDIDAQSNYHDVENPDTGHVSGENAARLVRNRGPITAKITASGKHNNYGGDNRAALSLVAWKFAGDNGEVHGLIEEKLNDDTVKIDIDCLLRNGKEAIVGGVISSESYPALSKRSLDGRRAYVKVVDGIVDAISAITFDDQPTSHCKNVDAKLFNDIRADELLVNVCSKRDGDWNECMAKEQSDQLLIE